MRASLTNRVFAALELPPEVTRRLEAAMVDLRQALPRGSVRWVRPEGIHLTLKFYGEVGREHLPELQAALGRAAARVPPVRLEVAGLGVFPNLLRPNVIWAGVGGDLAGLTELFEAVDRASVELGFKAETREFSPHLTLGRVRGKMRPGEQRELGEALEAMPSQHFGTCTADTLSLMRSRLQPGGSVYTRLFAATLSPGVP